MMSTGLEVPTIDDMTDLGVVVELSDQPGVVSVTAWAKDGSSVVLTWDEVACSASIRWLHGHEERLVLERETVVKISVDHEGGIVEFRVWSRSEGLAGELMVRLAGHVSMHDAMLRV
jgi:hypothetical protein